MTGHYEPPSVEQSIKWQQVFGPIFKISPAFLVWSSRSHRILDWS